MKTKFISLLLLLVACGTSAPSGDTGPKSEPDESIDSGPAARADVGSIKDPAFFRITRDGRTTYLLATVHAVPLSALPEKVKSFIDGIKYIVLEINPSTKPDAELMDFLTAKGGPKKPLDALSAEDRKTLFDAVKPHLAKSGWSAEEVESLHPWAAIMALISVAEDDGMDFQLFRSKVPYREFLEEHSAQRYKDDKEVKEIAHKPTGEILEGLRELLRAMRKGMSILDIPKAKQLVADYKTLTVLQQLDKSDLPDPGKARRNAVMASQIDKFHDEPADGDKLIAFGIAHFSGRQGVVNLLNGKNFKFEKMTADGHWVTFDYLK